MHGPCQDLPPRPTSEGSALNKEEVPAAADTSILILYKATDAVGPWWTPPLKAGDSQGGHWLGLRLMAGEAWRTDHGLLGRAPLAPEQGDREAVAEADTGAQLYGRQPTQSSPKKGRAAAAQNCFYWLFIR